MYINKYLESGDEQILDTIIATYPSSFYYTKEFYNFFRNVYDYNNTLGAGEKIGFVGVDMQHSNTRGFNYLLSLLSPLRSTDSVPGAVMDAIELIFEKNLLYEADMINLLDRIDDSTEMQKKLSDDNYKHLVHAIRSIRQEYTYDEYRDSPAERREVREEAICHNYSALYSEHGKGLAIMGAFHTDLQAVLDEQSNHPNTASWLKTEMGLNIGGICIYYYECYYMDKNTGEPREVAIADSIELLYSFADMFTGDYALFRLDAPGSRIGDLTKSYQYAICMKNSPAATLYEQRIKQELSD